jgi:hypothetical protein
MERHLRRCPACSAQKAAEEEVLTLLREEITADTPEEAAALERVARRWQESIPVPTSPPRPAPARPFRPWRLLSPRWMTASAALALVAGILVFSMVTEPTRAIAAVAGAMAKVQRFHLRMEVPLWGVRYEGWGAKGVGVRVEEWQGSRRTAVVVDDGRKLRRYYPEERVVRRSASRLKEIFQQAAGFSASRLLRLSDRGKLFEGQDWLGEATAREVSRVRRDGREQRRIQVDLKDGFFERMIVYADRETDRLTQANLYTDSNSPDERPFARVFLDYPEQVEQSLFQLQLPAGTQVRKVETESDLPE